MRKSVLVVGVFVIATLGFGQNPADIERGRKIATDFLRTIDLAPKGPLKFSTSRSRELVFVDPGRVEVYVNMPTNTAVMLFNQGRILERAKSRKPAKQLKIQSKAQMILFAEKLRTKLKVPADYVFEGVRVTGDGIGIASWSPRPNGYGFINFGIQIRIEVDRRDGVVLSFGRSVEVEIVSKTVGISKGAARKKAESVGFKLLPNHKLGYVLPNSEFGGPGRAGQPPYRLRLAYAFQADVYLQWEIWVDAGDGKILGGLAMAKKSTVK